MPENLKSKKRRKDNPLRELFGSVKFSKPTEELLRESRENMSKFDK